MKLFFNALTKYIMGLFLVGVLLFLPAGSFNYANGWLFIGLLFAICGNHCRQNCKRGKGARSRA